MSGYSTKVFIAVLAVLAIGCMDISDPAPLVEHQPPETSVASSLSLNSDSVLLEEGGEFLLTGIVRDQRGQRMLNPPSISYFSTSSAIVTVESGGLVTGVAPGRAVIRATLTAGQVTLVDSAFVTVKPAPVYDHLVLSADTYGWNPPIAHMYAGSQVEWKGGLIAVSGVPVRMIYLWKKDTPDIVAEMDMSNGSITRTLNTVGEYIYCSNACWDPPEWGTIIVDNPPGP